MRELFYQKIAGEYQLYKNSILKGDKEEIYKKCYEIDMIINLYEILMEKTEGLPDYVLAVFLNKGNILLELYDLWLKKDDTNYQEIETYVEEVLKETEEKIAV